MKNVKSLNLKNMKETLVNYSGNVDDLNTIWDTFYKMRTMGFISNDTWRKFCNECAGWYVTEDQNEVRDSQRDDKLIWKYTSDAEYRA